MLKITSTRRVNLKSVVAASLITLTALSCSIRGAVGAPTSKVLTPAETAQRKAAYLRYQRYVQNTLLTQERNTHNQKLVLKKQIEQKEAASEAAAAAAAGTTPAPKTARKHVPIKREDILLVMPEKGAKAEDIKESIASANGEICGRLGAGGLGVILVKPKTGRVVELQKALAADTKDFKIVSFNTRHYADFIPTTEPTFSKSWHLMRMNVPDAWDHVFRAGIFPMPVAVFDSGTQGPEPFTCFQGANCTGSIANDKIDDLGFDFDGFLGTGLFSDSIKDQEDDIVHIGNFIKTMTYGITDQNGHGTWVGSTISGSPYNGMGSGGINPQVPVYPIKIADGPKGKCFTDQLACVKAMCVMYDMANTRIINISYQDMMNARSQPILHEFFKDWYYRKNGLIFCSAGNAGENLSMANQPYINCVSAMDHKAGMVLVNQDGGWKSGSGTAVDFTAPGQDITVCNQDGSSNTVNGTSFSSPICAGVASMIWAIAPNLKNTEVEKIMRDSCENTDGPNTWNPQFGWGMPDALKCCIAAEASKK